MGKIRPWQSPVKTKKGNYNVLLKERGRKREKEEVVEQLRRADGCDRGKWVKRRIRRTLSESHSRPRGREKREGRRRKSVDFTTTERERDRKIRKEQVV